MRQLTDTERLGVAMSLLSEHEDIDEYARLCAELEQEGIPLGMKPLPEQDCGHNGFHNTPAECENFECATCPFNDGHRRAVGCPYIKESTENIESQQIREVAKNTDPNFTIKLPALSPDKWLDGTVENTWVDVNLAGLLGYVADMVE